MADKTDWKLLARYLSGECSKEETKKIDAWLDSHPENRKLIESLELIWRTQEIQPPASDIEKLWTETADRARISLDSTELKARKAPFLFPQLNLRFLRYAVILLTTASLPLIIWVLTKTISPPQKASEMSKVLVKNGEKAELVLSDGTQVTLDSGSHLTYPDEFTSNRREVHLIGQGYFEVSSDKERPFIVQTDNAVIKVLGTSFDVRAWPQNKKVEVIVVEGKVSFCLRKGDMEEAVIISKGQLSVLSEEGRPSEPHHVNIQERLGWINNEAVFYDTPLREILDQLERWYDLHFILRDESLTSEHLTIHLENKPIDDIMELISTLSDLEYERRDDFIILKPNKNK